MIEFTKQRRWYKSLYTIERFQQGGGVGGGKVYLIIHIIFHYLNWKNTWIARILVDMEHTIMTERRKK